MPRRPRKEVNDEERDVEVGDSGADKHPHRNRDQRGSKFLHQVLKPKDKKDCARNEMNPES